MKKLFSLFALLLPILTFSQEKGLDEKINDKEVLVFGSSRAMSNINPEIINLIRTFDLLDSEHNEIGIIG